jgi:hypothetical protein
MAHVALRFRHSAMSLGERQAIVVPLAVLDLDNSWITGPALASGKSARMMKSRRPRQSKRARMLRDRSSPEV